MLRAMPLHPCLFGRLQAFRDWLTRTDPYGPTLTPDEMLEKELRRLAETSPHLLPDIGFEEIGTRGGRRVFRRGGVRFGL